MNHRTTNGTPWILAVAACACLALATSAVHGQMTTIVEESFGGAADPLNGTTAETFDPAITGVGGAGAWMAGASFVDNGTVSVDASNRSAYLNLGSHINNAKGTAAGKFELTMTISETAGTWISLGFAAENAPNIAKNFTNTGTGSATTTGLGTIIYRAQTASPAGELDMFGGAGNANGIDGPDGNTGNRTLTVALDLTPAGGYDGTSNFGTVTWSDSALGVLGSYTYPTSRNFGSILVSEAGSSGGTISALTLKQVSVDLPPNLVSTNPADDSVNVPIGANLVATFSELIQAGTGSVTIKKTAGDGMVESFDVATSDRLTFNGSQLAIDPTDDLEVGIEYYVLIAPAAVKDLSNNPFAGIAAPGAWSFTTDNTPPTTSGTSPVANAIDVHPAANLTLTFGENVQLGAGLVTIRLAADGSIVETIDVATPGAVVINGASGTLVRSLTLARSTAYYVNIAAGAFTDLSGNAFAGIADATTWAFTTAAIVWKQSNSLTLDRLAGNLSNAAGMNGDETILFNLDGTVAGEPTTANGVSWGTSSKGSPATAAAAARVWIVADLGASYDLGTLSVWNFQWNHPTSGDLSNRGVSQFDVYVRDAEADTDDGTAGGIPINLDNPADDAAEALANDAAFNPGLTNPWQLALENQSLARAPNNDSYAGETYDLTGTTGRFVAIVVDSYYGGGGIALGKVRIEVGPPGGGPRLAITRSGGTLGFSWNSVEGKRYDLVSSTDLTSAPSTWPPYHDGVTTYQNLAASGTGTNTLTGVLANGPRRFFAVLEESPPPLLSADFEQNNGGFTNVNLTAGADWEWGAPDSPDLGGGAVTAGYGGSAKCWGTNLTGPYSADTDAGLRSPVIDLTGVQTARLSFALAIDSQIGDTWQVDVIDDTTDAVIANLIPATADGNDQSAAWARVGPLTLPAAALGQAVRIEWRFTGNADGSFNGAYLDDVALTAGP